MSSRQLSGGLRLSYRRSTTVDAQLTRLVEAERICCGDAGITWTLRLHDEAVLDVRVPDSLRDRAEMRVISEVLAG